MTKFTFNSKQSYLQYRAIWKQRYAALSQLIRDLKYCRKYSSLGTKRYKRIAKENGNAFGFSPQGLAAHYRKLAASQLEELHEAKVEAQRQYAESKAQLVNSQ